MVVLNKIYTRTGDTGETHLSDMSRAPKYATRVHAYGTVDELNAAIGVARLYAKGDNDTALSRIQNDLFDLGADLSRPNLDKDGEAEYPVLRTVTAQVERLEAEIDAMTAVLEPLKSFILPAGTPLARSPPPCTHGCPTRRKARCGAGRRGGRRRKPRRNQIS